MSLAHSFLGNHRDTFAEIGDTYFYDGERTVSEVRSRYAVNESHYASEICRLLSARTQNQTDNGCNEIDVLGVYALMQSIISDNLIVTLAIRQDDHDMFSAHTTGVRRPRRLMNMGEYVSTLRTRMELAFVRCLDATALV